MKKSAWVVISFRIPKEKRAEVRATARKVQLPPSELYRRALDRVLLDAVNDLPKAAK